MPGVCGTLQADSFRGFPISMHKLGKPLGEPLKNPGTRLANEYHGLKIGRLVLETIKEGESILVRPRKCPKCHIHYQFDNRNFLCCPVCGQEPEQKRENALRTQAQSERLEEYKRLKAYKQYRTYDVKAI